MTCTVHSSMCMMCEIANENHGRVTRTVTVDLLFALKYCTSVLDLQKLGNTHRVIYLKETRVRTAHAARKMLLCRLEAAKRHLNPGKIFAHARNSPRSIRSVCVFSPWPWLVIIDNSLCVCVF